jgi:hypothetical protein
VKKAVHKVIIVDSCQRCRELLDRLVFRVLLVRRSELALPASQLAHRPTSNREGAHILGSLLL